MGGTHEVERFRGGGRVRIAEKSQDASKGSEMCNRYLWY